MKRGMFIFPRISALRRSAATPRSAKLDLGNTPYRSDLPPHIALRWRASSGFGSCCHDMAEQVPNRAASLPASRRLLPLLLVLFVGSGCAALIYEIVWFQLLQLVIGSSAVSLGVLLGTFMGGMCLGSLALPRLVSGRRHPLRVYALLELGIGIIGIVVLFGMPLSVRFTRPTLGTVCRGLCCGGWSRRCVCCRPPC